MPGTGGRTWTTARGTCLREIAFLVQLMRIVYWYQWGEHEAAQTGAHCYIYQGAGHATSPTPRDAGCTQRKDVFRKDQKKKKSLQHTSLMTFEEYHCVGIYPECAERENTPSPGVVLQPSLPPFPRSRKVGQNQAPQPWPNPQALASSGHGLSFLEGC